jgi:hypothetical protein
MGPYYSIRTYSGVGTKVPSLEMYPSDLNTERIVHQTVYPPSLSVLGNLTFLFNNFPFKSGRVYGLISIFFNEF